MFLIKILTKPQSYAKWINQTSQIKMTLILTAVSSVVSLMVLKYNVKTMGIDFWEYHCLSPGQCMCPVTAQRQAILYAYVTRDYGDP